ncbi:MAG: VOC family protein [bacterium]|nr:VOC family protein [bacterium]MCP4965439.1 VOC family protein [bacterium]
MKLLPLVYVTDMDRSVDFYSKLLPASSIVTSSPYWTELQVGGASLALHISETVDHDADGMGLGLDAATSLEDVVAQLGEAGIKPSGEICAQPFGRSISVQDPDGLVIQINEHSVPATN